MSLTAQLIDIISNTTFDSLSAADVATAKRLISDGIAVAVAGSGEAAPPGSLETLSAADVRELSGRLQ